MWFTIDLTESIIQQQDITIIRLILITIENTLELILVEILWLLIADVVIDMFKIKIRPVVVMPLAEEVIL